MANSHYKLESQSGSTYEVSVTSAMNLDSVSLSKNQVHYLYNHKGCSVEVHKIKGKLVSFSMNGKQHTFEVQDQHDQLVDALGFDKVAKVNLSNINSPMPGLILDIMVDEGQSFNQGDSLLILEAMKMENVIKAAADGVVKSINASKGDAVEKGQILLELE